MMSYENITQVSLPLGWLQSITDEKENTKNQKCSLNVKMFVNLLEMLGLH